MQNLTRIIFKDIHITKNFPSFFSISITKKLSNNSAFANNILKMNLEESTRKTRSFKMKSREVQKEETGEIIESTIEEEVEDTFEYASKKMKLSQGVKEKVTNFVMESQKDHEEVATMLVKSQTH